LAIQLDSECSVRIEVNATAQLARITNDDQPLTPDVIHTRLQLLLRYLLHTHLYSYYGGRQYNSISHLACVCPQYVLPVISGNSSGVIGEAATLGEAWIEQLEGSIR
jgi:hypothetical protein